MFDTTESVLFGFAAVLDTVLLLIMLERVNRPEVPVWLTLSFFAVWLLHVGDFLHGLLSDSSGGTATLLDDWCMTMMAFGLMLLPSTVLHGGLRLLKTGSVPRPPMQWKYLFVYLPVLLIVPATYSIFDDSERDFRRAIDQFTAPYVVWLLTANIVAAVVYGLASRRLNQASLAPFLRKFSVLLVLMSAMVVSYLLVPASSPSEPVLRMLIALSPVIPVILFAWYAFRHHLMPLIFERTLVYGGCLITVFWLHHVTVSPLTAALERQAQFDFVVLEVTLLVALILAWRPLRERVSESLRYLLSSSVTQVRDATRLLSVQLSQRSADSSETLTCWLCESLRDSLRVESTRIIVCSGFQLDVMVPIEEPANTNENFDVPAFCKMLAEEPRATIDLLNVTNPELRIRLQASKATIVFCFSYRDVSGFVLLGPRRNADWLSQEQRSTLALLFEQYAAVLFNQRQELIRRTSERQAMQQEKLFVLGLLAGSMAHELRNPLSSMRTIATLLSEDLADRPEHQKDALLILQEIDRLTATTQRMLDSARPADDSRRVAEPDLLIVRLLQILSHLARQYGATIQTDLRATGVSVSCTEAELSEILFNLIKNAIEAVQNCASPAVRVETRVHDDTVVIEVIDNGNGISPELQNSLFQPFVTGKPHGTGLGLYVVSERVRELRGEIRSRTEIGVGTAFEVWLPCLLPT